MFWSQVLSAFLTPDDLWKILHEPLSQISRLFSDRVEAEFALTSQNLKVQKEHSINLSITKKALPRREPVSPQNSEDAHSVELLTIILNELEPTDTKQDAAATNISDDNPEKDRVTSAPEVNDGSEAVYDLAQVFIRISRLMSDCLWIYDIAESTLLETAAALSTSHDLYTKLRPLYATTVSQMSQALSNILPTLITGEETSATAQTWNYIAQYLTDLCKRRCMQARHPNKVKQH